MPLPGRARFPSALIVLLLLLALSFPALPGAAQELPLAEPAEESTPAPESKPIPLVTSDGQIAKRLRGIFANINGLEAVTVEVEDGVVKLSGTSLTNELKTQAEEIASRLAGVVTVENDIAPEHRVAVRLQPLIERGRDFATQALAFLPLLGVAFVVILFFWLLGRLLTRSTRIFKPLARNAFIEALVKQVVRLALLLVGFIIAMSIIEANALLGSILGAAGVLGLAVGFAVRDTIENYIASILLSIRQPFAPNDHVLIQDIEGRVAQLNSRATIILTFDGNEVRIPNAIVYKAIITNFTRVPERRFQFEVNIGIGRENDLTAALAVALRAVQGAPSVLEEPKPFVVVDRLGDFNTVLKVHGWVDQTQSEFIKVRSEAIRRVKEAFDAAGISMPEPIQNVRTFPEPGSPAQEAAPQRQIAEPAPSEVATITDTRADRTIERKVEATRAAREGDLLDREAPRE